MKKTTACPSSRITNLNDYLYDQGKTNIRFLKCIQFLKDNRAKLKGAVLNKKPYLVRRGCRYGFNQFASSFFNSGDTFCNIKLPDNVLAELRAYGDYQFKNDPSAKLEEEEEEDRTYIGIAGDDHYNFVKAKRDLINSLNAIFTDTSSCLLYTSDAADE